MILLIPDTTLTLSHGTLHDYGLTSSVHVLCEYLLQLNLLQYQ